MVQKLKAKDMTVSETPDRRKLKILFTDNAIVDMLEFVEKTEVGKRPGAENDKVDLWDVERLDKRAGEGEGAVENGEV
jgi:ABC-type thiamine transport system ATPase subunit